MPLTGPVAHLLDEVAAHRSADRDVLTRLAGELRAHLPRQQLTVTRRGVPLLGSRVVGLRVLVGERVFRLDTTTGVTRAEIGRAVNGVVGSHTQVDVAQWAVGLRDALDQAAGGDLGTALGPLH